MLYKMNLGTQKKILVVCILLIFVTLAVYWRVNQCGFISIDDPVYVTQNIHIRSGITLDGLRWAFSTTYAEFWHPLTWLSLMFDYHLYGMNPAGYHLTNLILHIFSVLLLFLFLKQCTFSIRQSAFVAALFALHPIHVQSVAWIAERKDVLSAFFWMLTLFLYVYYVQKPVIKRYLFVVSGFICALMSKSMAVTLPVMMILLDYWPLKRFESEKDNIVLWQLREKTPFFILSALFSIITLYAQSSLYIEHSFSSRLANAPVAFMLQLGKILFPHDLAFVYPFPDQLPAWQVLCTMILIVMITAAVILAAKRLPYLFVGWLWYAITILPVIGIIYVGDPLADRYIYLPSIGIYIIAAWGVPSLIKNEAIHRKILFPAGIILLAVLSIFTWKQCLYWRTGEELFNRAIQVTENNYIAYNNLGVALFDEGKIKEAIEQYNRGISIKPSALIYGNRGSAYGMLGRYELATDDFSKAIGLNSRDQTAYYNRGSAYGKLGRYKEAIEDFSMAIRLKPDYTEAYYNRGVTYILVGDDLNGCHDAQKACALGNCKLMEFAGNRKLCP